VMPRGEIVGDGERAVPSHREVCVECVLLVPGLLDQRVGRNGLGEGYASLPTAAGLLRDRIASGVIASVLPSIMEPTEETGLAVGAVRRAIKIFVDEGAVHTVPGRGTFVTRPIAPLRVLTGRPLSGVLATAGRGTHQTGPGRGFRYRP